MKPILRTAAVLLALTGTGAQACVCCCIYPLVTDPVNSIQYGSILTGAGAAASAYSTANGIMGKISSAVGSKGSVPTTSYQTLAAQAPDVSMIMAITDPALPSATPSFSTSDTAGQWISAALFTNATGNSTTTALARRRAAARLLAARYAYSVALASMTDISNSQARAQALLQAGNAAKDQRAQVAAIIQTIEAVRAEVVALQRVEEAMLELQATESLDTVPFPATPVATGSQT